MRDRIGDRGLLARYGLVGVLNSATGWSVLFGLEFGFKIAPGIANAAGFGVGFICGFLCHRRLFSGSRTIGEAARYVVAVVVSFTGNQVALQLLHGRFGEAPAGRIACQAVAIVIYSGVLYAACQIWVFPQRRRVRVASI